MNSFSILKNVRPTDRVVQLRVLSLLFLKWRLSLFLGGNLFRLSQGEIQIFLCENIINQMKELYLKISESNSTHAITPD